MSVRSAVILAGGCGARFEDAWREPKGLYPARGETLVGRSVRLLRSRGIERIVVVAGFRANAYRAFAAGLPDVEVVEKRRPGSLGSFVCGARCVSGDFLCLESDLFYEARALDVLLDSHARDGILVSGATGAGDEVWVEAPTGRLSRMSKRREDLASVEGELVGVSRVSKELALEMARIDGEHYETDGFVGCVPGREISVVRVDDLLWGELDNDDHARRLHTVLAPAEAEVRRLLFTPGPATTSPVVKSAMAAPDMSTREASFRALYQSVRQRVVRIAGDSEHVRAIGVPGNGTTALEAALATFVGTDGVAVVVDNGDYGARLRKICEVTGIEHIHVAFPWGTAFDLAIVEEVLEQARGRVTHLVFVHHETSSGRLNPCAELVAMAQRYGLRVIVDAMSSYGALPLTVGGDGVDVAVTSSNKCLEGAAGLGLVVASRESLSHAARRPRRTLALDLVAEDAALEDTGESRFTVPPQVVQALDAALTLFEREGREGRLARYRGHARRLRLGLRDLGCEPLLPSQDCAGIVLSFRTPPGIRFAELHESFAARGLVVYPLKSGSEEGFRLGVLGALSSVDVDRLLAYFCAFFAATKVQAIAPIKTAPTWAATAVKNNGTDESAPAKPSASG